MEKPPHYRAQQKDENEQHEWHGGTLYVGGRISLTHIKNDGGPERCNEDMNENESAVNAGLVVSR